MSGSYARVKTHGGFLRRVSSLSRSSECGTSPFLFERSGDLAVCCLRTGILKAFVEELRLVMVRLSIWICCISFLLFAAVFTY